MQDENSLEESVGLGAMHSEFVPVTFADTREEAERLRDILESRNIPAMSDDGAVGACADAVLGRGLPVLVPEHMHDRASDVIADLESVADEDTTLNDTEDDEEFDDDDDSDEEEDEDLDGDFDELDDDLDEDFDDEDEDEDDEDDKDDDDDYDLENDDRDELV